MKAKSTWSFSQWIQLRISSPNLYHDFYVKFVSWFSNWINSAISTLIYILIPNSFEGAPPWSSGSVLDHRSLPPVFESRRGHNWRLFRLSLHLITFGGRSVHLTYHVHTSSRKTSIIIIIYIIHQVYDEPWRH